MNRYITILLAVVALHTSAVAKSSSSVGADVHVREFNYHADSVRLDIDFNFENLKIGANESAVFLPKIYKGDNTLELPTVVVQRRGGAKSYDRAVVLDNAKSKEAYEEWYGTPYQTIDYYGSQRQESVRYSISIPYQKWMVDSELYVDCSTCGCCRVKDEGMLIPDDNALHIDIPTVLPYVPTPQVALIKPEKVAVKRRDIAYSSALIFKVNSTYIDPNIEVNRAELASIDGMMQSVISDADYTITKVNIIGYASPEGRLVTNMRLSKGRAAALETLMKRKYRMIDSELYNVDFGGENWAKLYDIVSDSDIEGRDDVLSIIDNISIENGREKALMLLNGGVTYKYLLKNVFPATRLVVVDVEYNVDAYDLERIGELIDTKPQNLSLEEMYRLSETYNIDDDEFVKIFLTAVRVFPDDEVAQNNALATEIRRGDISAVEDVAALVRRDTNSAELANSLGVYCMMTGDYDTAKEMLARAVELGSERAKHNAKQLELKLDNIRQIKDSEAFRSKIYEK